jgi:hypothetical protein
VAGGQEHEVRQEQSSGQTRHKASRPEPNEGRESAREVSFVVSRTYVTFGDIAGKLHTLRIECTRCARKGRYNVAKLVAQYGRRGNMSKWVLDLRGDCPKRSAAHLHERCDLICPDLPKVL